MVNTDSCRTTKQTDCSTHNQKREHQHSLGQCQRHRIAMICDFFHPNLGGVENHIYSLSQKLIARGHIVIIITHQYLARGNQQKDTQNQHHNQQRVRQGVRYLPGPLKVYYCPIVPMGSSINVTVPTFTVTLPLLRQILLREQINIVHAHQATSTMGSECIVYASMLGIPTIYTDHSLFGFHGVASIILNRVLQATLSTIDAVICVSHTCRDNFILRTKLPKKRPLCSQEQSCQPKIHVIPNAVSPSQFLPLSNEEMIYNNDLCVTTNTKEMKRIKVVVVSRLVYRKGVDLLVGIIPNICHHISNVDFIIAGNGNKLLQLQEMVERENIQHRVEFLGSVQHSDIRNVLVRGDVFLNCSLTESFCIAILEAACCGLLVVSTNVGGVPEVLPSDMILLGRPTIPDMVHCLIQAIQQQTNTPIDRWATHERVKEMYSWERVAIETERVYDRARTAHIPKSLYRRVLCYHESLGGLSGFVVCFLALIVELWYCCVELYYPREQINCVPVLSIKEFIDGTATK